MSNKSLTYPRHNEAQSERVALRLGFSFHIVDGAVVEHRGCKSEIRPATSEEREMWAKLTPREWAGIPDFKDLPSPDITVEELGRAFESRSRLTLNPEDASTLPALLGDRFYSFTLEELVAEGCIGEMEEGVHTVWANPLIPKGYYWRGSLKKGVEYSQELLWKVESELLPFTP